MGKHSPAPSSAAASNLAHNTGWHPLPPPSTESCHIHIQTLQPPQPTIPTAPPTRLRPVLPDSSACLLPLPACPAPLSPGTFLRPGVVNLLVCPSLPQGLRPTPGGLSSSTPKACGLHKFLLRPSFLLTHPVRPHLVLQGQLKSQLFQEAPLAHTWGEGPSSGLLSALCDPSPGPCPLAQRWSEDFPSPPAMAP